MKFTDILIITILVLLLLVIVFNLFVYGRDLATFPRRARISNSRPLTVRTYYPGSIPDDDYTDDEEEDDHSSRRHRSSSPGYHPDPKGVAKYVETRLRQ